MSGFYPPMPKVFVVKGNKVVDTRSGLIVASATNGKDARYICGLKNIAFTM